MSHIVLSFNLKQLASTPTRITNESLLDLLFVSNVVGTDEVEVVDGMSDHKMLCPDFKILKNYTKKKNARQERMVKDFQNADDVSILDYLDERFDGFSRLGDAIDPWRKFKHIVSYCTHFVPSRSVRARRHNERNLKDQAKR